MKKNISPVRISLLFLLCTMIATGCSKSSGSENNSSYYMTGTVSGKAWSANLSNNSYKSPVLAGVETTNNITIVFVLGIQVANSDTSAFAVVFPKNTSLNQTLDFDITQNTEAAYIEEASPGSSTYNGYNTASTSGGSGNYSVSLIDDANKVIEGTFSGTFALTTGSGSVTVTNGKFRCPYTTDVDSVSNLTGLKF
jgi:hypothetical protein